jgi:hypothetical protein
MGLLQKIILKFPNSLKLFLLNSNLLFFSWSLLSNYSEQHRHKYDPNKVDYSYSQTGEDAVCKKYLPESYGNYLDVGCGQPVHGSNTYFLYRRGWDGVAIDPILNNKRLFRYLRPRDTFKRILIGKKGSKSTFYEIIPYVYSTTSGEFAGRWVSEGRKIKSETLLESESLRDFHPFTQPRDPSFLSIDIEGKELECLEGINFEFYCPRVICIEEWEESIRDGDSEIRKFLRDRKYQLMDRTSLSSIFVHAEFLDSNTEFLTKT